MNAAEAGMRAWLDTPGGRVFAAQHGGAGRALQAMYEQDAAESSAAVALQDEQERTRGTRPDFGHAKLLVRRPGAGYLGGPTDDVVKSLNRLDPRWRVQAYPPPFDNRVVLPGE